MDARVGVKKLTELSKQNAPQMTKYATLYLDLL